MAQRQKTVLLIEDDRSIRETMQELLEDEGYAVVTALNGAEGLRQLKKMKHSCLVLLDLLMPVMDGNQFLKELDEGHGHVIAAISVVVMSAASEGQLDASARSKATGFVRKPVDLEASYVWYSSTAA